MNSFKVPVEVDAIARKCNAYGFDVWVVGGAIRNYYLGLDITDWDLATQATPDEVMQLFPHANDAGADFGCILIPSPLGAIQMTTLREESAYKDHRRPHHVVFTDQIERDLTRRDFTCNAIAFHILDQVWRDPFGGRADIHNEILRAVGDPEKRLQEDALRVLRAIRFMSELGFSLAESLKQALIIMMDEIVYVSRERIYIEWKRILCGAHVDHALAFLSDMRAVHILPAAIPKPPKLSLVPPVFWLRMVYLYANDLEVFVAYNHRVWVDFGIPKKQWLWVHALAVLLLEDKDLLPETQYNWLSLSLRVDDKDSLITLLGQMKKKAVVDYLVSFHQLHPRFSFHALPLQTHEMAELAGIPLGPEVGKMLKKLHVWLASHPQKVSRGSIEKWLKESYIDSR